MNKIRKKRLIYSIGLVFLVAAVSYLVLFALRSNINLFFTPTQIKAGEAPIKREFRVGGLVRKGSVNRQRGTLKVAFVLTDTANDITVHYDGVLPDLFREGQGIVAQGKLDEEGEFVASIVLAKHDEKYMPPPVKDALEKANHRKEATTSDKKT